MKKAVLDIGSNSVKFMLAEVRPEKDPRILHEDHATTRLAAGLEKTGVLTPETRADTIRVCIGYFEKAREEGAKRILALATSAVREARNREEFAAQFKEATGVELVVLSEKQESALVFAGALSDPSFPQQDVVVMDVGGGSAEWIRGDHGRILKQHSAPLGCVRMTEKFLHGDPYRDDSFQTLVRFLGKQIRKLKPDFELEHRPIIATGGTACALAAFDCAIDGREQAVHGHILEYDRVHTFVNHLRSLPQAERQKLPGIPRSRADVITAGAAAFVVAMHVLGADAMQVSIRGMRYGALYA